MTAKAYIGNELELFSRATHWKRYCTRRIKPWLGSRVLEVGAGMAGTTRWLCDGSQIAWCCLEPDAALCARIQARIDAGQLPACCRAVNGTLTALEGAASEFDTILYIDVLEHIENDRAELQRAAGLLQPGGTIIVLSPAHGFLLSPFDRRIGHFRRYTRDMLRRICPGKMVLEQLAYLDSVGLLASLANRCFLEQATPTRRQIAFWDKFMVRTSVLCDPLFGYRLGKSILAVMRLEKPGGDRA